MVQLEVKALFTVAMLTSVITSGIIFTLISTTSHQFSSLTCVNYSPQLRIGQISKSGLEKNWPGDHRLSLLLPLNANLISTASVPYENANKANESSEDYSSLSIPMPISISSPVNTSATPQAVTPTIVSASASAADRTATIPERDAYPRIRSWYKSVLTESRPEIRQNCSKLRDGDRQELQRTQLLLGELDFEVAANYSTCAQIRTEFSDNFYVSDVEKRFPLAFVLVVHTNAQQILRFLKAIYRPHNLYCVHPDPQSGQFFGVFRRLSECLPNLLVASRIHHVKYYRPSTIFRAQMSCFRDLSESRSRRRAPDWKYVINLCGRELPLKTNRQIVESLMKMNGMSVIKPHPIDQYTLNTCFANVRARVGLDTNCTGGGDHVSISAVENCEPFLRDHRFKLQKSMTYNAYSREFVRYFLHDPTARALLDWLLRNCHTPEEHFYAMAAVIPGAPGGNSSANWPANYHDDPSVFRTVWYHYKSSPHRVAGEKCAGKVVHSICILNAAELPRIHDVMTNANVWFFNKYFMEEDHVVMDCVEGELGRKNREEFERDQLLKISKLKNIYIGTGKYESHITSSM